MTPLQWIVRSLGFLCVASSCTDRAEVETCFELEELRRFGYAEHVADETAARTSGVQGGVLGNIRGTISGPGETVYVLDRYWQKIVVFQPDGSVERVILGGEGEGPGEFRLPMHIATTPTGFSVLDFELLRVTEFDWTGEVTRTLQLETPSPWRHLIRGDTVWVTHNSVGTTSGPFVHLVALRNGDTTPGPALAPDDRAFGTGFGIASGAADEVLVSTARPGVWMLYAEGKWSRRGMPQFPNVAPPLTERIAPRLDRVTPAQHGALGLATLGDSLVLQGIYSYPRPFDWNDPPERDESTHSLGVYRPDGDHLATLSLPSGVSPLYLSSDRETGRLFMHVTDPYPQVVEYRLGQCLVGP